MRWQETDAVYYESYHSWYLFILYRFQFYFPRSTTTARVCHPIHPCRLGQQTLEVRQWMYYIIHLNIARIGMRRRKSIIVRRLCSAHASPSWSCANSQEILKIHVSLIKCISEITDPFFLFLFFLLFGNDCARRRESFLLLFFGLFRTPPLKCSDASFQKTCDSRQRYRLPSTICLSLLFRFFSFLAFFWVKANLVSEPGSIEFTQG